MMHSRLLRYGRLLLALAILCFLLKQLYSSLTELEEEAVVFQPFWFVLSLVLLFIYQILLVYPWRKLYVSAAQKSASFQKCWTLFQLTQFGKYVPGKVGQFVGIIALCQPLGLSKTAAIVSTIQGLALQCLIGVALGGTVLMSPILHNDFYGLHLENTLFIGLTVLIGGGGTVVLMLFFCNTKLVEKYIRTLFFISGIRHIVVTYFFLWIYFGIAFFLFIKSIHPLQYHQFFKLTSVYSLAWSIGFLSLITPGGLGVRESLLSVLLTLYLPPTTAMLVALLSRFWILSGELFAGSIAFGFYYRQRHVQSY